MFVTSLNVESDERLNCWQETVTCLNVDEPGTNELLIDKQDVCEQVRNDWIRIAKLMSEYLMINMFICMKNITQCLKLPCISYYRNGYAKKT